MEQIPELTRGVCKTICDPNIPDTTPFTLKPVVQVVHMSRVTANPSQKINMDLWSIVVSDGDYKVKCLLKKELSYLVHNQIIVKYAIIQVDNFARKLEKR